MASQDAPNGTNGAGPEKKGALKSVFGAPKALGKGVGKGVMSVGTGVTKGVTMVGGAAVDGVGTVGRGAVGITGAVAGGTVAGIGAVAGTAISGVGAVAGGAKNAIGSMPGMGHLKDDPKNSARALAIDTSTSNAPKTTASLADAVVASKPITEDDIPGTIPKTVLPGVPDWMPRGWKEVGGIEGRGVRDTKTQEELSILSTYLKDQYYGQWYHNGGVIIFAVVSTRFITAIGLGWGWIFVILAFCATMYSLSIERTRRYARDDIQRELVKTRLITETESADWLNGFLDRFWLMYEPVLSATIIAAVAPALDANCPSFLEGLAMPTFTLGNKAPRIDYVRTFPKTPNDEVVMDWALSFTPNDIQDITPRQLKDRVNPKIVLEIRLGKGFISTGMPILLEDLNFSGKMRIKLKLMSAMPHVQKVEMSFLEKPQFDFVLKPIGGETLGFDINMIPGLEPFIHNQVHAALGPMMYDPNVFTIDLEQLMSGTPLDAAVGVLKIHILDAHGLKSTKIGGGAPDPYVSMSLGTNPAVARTKTIEATATPAWGETQFVLINSLSDVLNLNVFDYNEHRPDDLIGTVMQELKELADDAEREGVVGKVLDGGKDRGDLRFDLTYYPTIQPVKNADGVLEPVPDIPTGIVRLTVHQAKDFDRAGNDLNSFAEIFLGASKTPCHVTDVVKKSKTPAYESHTEFLVADKNASVITVVCKDKAGGSLGRLSMKLAEIMAAKASGNDWFPLAGTRDAKVRISADFRPVAMAGVIDAASSYQPPIGILRVLIKNATDIKNLELAGKSDPYVRVSVNNKTLARTEVENNNLNPVWDQFVYVPVHSLRERVVLEVMDYENVGKDRTLGTVSIDASDFIVANESDLTYPYASKAGPQTRSDRIKQASAGQFKGTLNYEVDFCPAVAFKDGVSFEAKANDLEEAAAARTAASTNGAPTPIASGTATPVAAPVPAVPVKEAAKEVAKDAVNGGTPKEGEAEPEPEKPTPGVVLSDAEILGSQSGVLVFQCIEGHLAKKGCLEVLFDEGYWPAYTSERARSQHARWDQVGEGFVRELDVGTTWLRINAADDPTADKDEIVAELHLDTKEFLEQSLNKEATFVLTGEDGSRSTIKMSSRFVPVGIKLTARESINDQGMLRVTVISAKNLKAADRGGKSDPNVTFLLNGDKVFKSETKKKTVNPVWNETFEVAVPSRVKAQLAYEVDDWNTVGSADELGGGLLNLAALEPMELQNLDVPVVLEGKQFGTLQCNVLFRPQIIARTRQKTSTFSAAGRTVTNIGGAAIGAPVAVGKGVVAGGGAVVSGVGHVITAPTRLFRKKDRSSSVNEPPTIVETPPVAGQGYNVAPQVQLAPNTQVSGPADLVEELVPAAAVGAIAAGETLPEGAGAATSEPGTLTVAVIGAKDLKPSGSHGAKDLKPYAVVKLGAKTMKTDYQKGVECEWNDTFNFNLLPGTTQFVITVYDKHSFGKDSEIGEATIDIWRHIQPAVPTADVFVELNDGTGLLKLRLDWQTGLMSKGLARTRSRTPSVSSKNGVSTDTPRSSKFTMTPQKGQQ